MINSTADKVSALTKALERKGFGDQALEVAVMFSELNEAVDRALPLGTAHLGLIFSGDERILDEREQFRAEYYNKVIKNKYEHLLF